MEETVTIVTYHIEDISDFDQEPYQTTLENVLSGKMHHSTDGFVKIHTPADLKDEIIDQVVKQIGGNKPAAVREALLYSRPSHWALGRFIYSPSQRKFSYVAGQDQSWEMSNLRKYLYKIWR